MNKPIHKPNLANIVLFDKIKKDDLVKISDMKNAFWVKVIKIRKSKHYRDFVGVIDNQLTNSDYTYGDLIAFHDSNIFDLVKKNKK